MSAVRSRIHGTQRNSQWLGFCAAFVELSRQLRVRLTHLRHLYVGRAARFAQFGAQIDRHASAVRGGRLGLQRVRSRRGRVGLRSRNLLLRVAWARQECAGIHGCFERQRERDRVQENRLQMSVLKCTNKAQEAKPALKWPRAFATRFDPPHVSPPLMRATRLHCRACAHFARAQLREAHKRVCVHL